MAVEPLVPTNQPITAKTIIEQSNTPILPALVSRANAVIGESCRSLSAPIPAKTLEHNDQITSILAGDPDWLYPGIKKNGIAFRIDPNAMNNAINPMVAKNFTVRSCQLSVTAMMTNTSPGMPM